jgi:hypothetical protein
MTVFISWSGERSKAVALALKSTLRKINVHWSPWVSEIDISAGRKWRRELENALRSASFGIVCVSRRTLKSPWVLYETGVLSASKKVSGICPYLIDHKAAEIVGPLSEFQSREATKAGTLDLLFALNGRSVQTGIPEDELRNKLEELWAQLEESIRLAPNEANIPAYNNLDEKGVECLLHIHFLATSNRLMNVFVQGISELKDDDLNFDLLLVNVKRVLNDGRVLLAPFHSEPFGNVQQFLDECLATTDIQGRIKQGLEIVMQSKGAKARRKTAYQLIQQEQSEIFKIVIDRLRSNRKIL